MLEGLWNLWCVCEPEQEPLSQTVGLEMKKQAEPSQAALLCARGLIQKRRLSRNRSHFPSLYLQYKDRGVSSMSDSTKTRRSAHSSLKISDD